MTSLNVKPYDWTFPHQGGIAHFTLTSTMGFNINKRMGFKATPSNPGLYKAKPENGFIEPNGKVEVIVTRAVGPAGKNDELVVAWAEVEPGVTDARLITNSPVLAEVGLVLKTA
ncbi:hypothetical protein PRIPAC_94814 [Pristionchus pacificus]|uniref:MSP domain-containing protein n=1 Tax=Pristionchus pacificus TaxID=54126 RepID=A0A2A6B9Y5_PRIPA|nr:hypothetical protein PRIPAC_94814 [Pristionchus pacificus]|eukprot:PDM62689.1 MSP domain-containing protein [Pristionchus pacificus]